MIRNEFRKLFHRGSTVVLLALLFAANALLVWNLRLPGSQPYSGIEAVHIRSLYAALPEDPGQALAALEQQYDALLNSEADVFLLTGDVYAERKLFSEVIERVGAAANYGETLRQIDENAQTLLLTGRYEPDSFGYRNVLKSRAAYEKLTEVRPQVIYSGAVELLPGGRITDAILVLICLLTALELIVSERITGTMALLKPARRGGLGLICAKILVATTLAVWGTGILYGMNLLIGLLRCGGVPMAAPIQSIHGFLRSPWKITIGTYLVCFFAIKALWAAAICAVVFAACHVGSSVLQCCCIVFPGLLLAPSGDIAASFSQLRSLDLLGHPISSFSANLIAMVFTAGAGFWTAALLHIRRAPFTAAIRNPRKKGPYRISTGLLRHEARKLFLMNGGIWVLVALAAVQLMSCSRFDPWISPQERLYMHYSEKLSGPANLEKDAFLASEQARFSALHAALESYEQALLRGELDQDAYASLASGINRNLQSEEIFLRVQGQYLTMKAQSCDYVCLTGYERLLGSEGQTDVLILMVQLLLALILGLSPIHAAERETGMALLLNLVPGRQKSASLKNILMALFTVAASVIVLTPHVLKIEQHYGLPGLFSMAASVPMLRIGTGTVLAGLALYAAGITALALLASCIIMHFSKKSGSTVQTIIASSILILPALFALLDR